MLYASAVHVITANLGMAAINFCIIQSLVTSSCFGCRGNVLWQVDDDLKQLIRGIDTPREFMDVERELQKAGMKPATNSARREAMAGVPRSQIPKPQKKKRRESKRTKYTNAHLPELFKSIQVP